jgi:hypothetical protein
MTIDLINRFNTNPQSLIILVEFHDILYLGKILLQLATIFVTLREC